MRHLLPLSLAVLLAFGAQVPAHAQQKPADTAVLPILNHDSGKVEAVLVLEPTDEIEAGSRARFGLSALGSTFGLQTGDSLALVCNRHTSNLASAIGNLANNCMLASLNDGQVSQRRGGHVNAMLSRPGGRVGVSAGNARNTLPAWLTPGVAPPRVDINDITLHGRKKIGTQGFVTIAGTVAKARLLSPAAAVASGLASDEWNSTSLSFGGGVGNFSANVIGQVVDTPGQPDWQGLGVGLTWHTPWSGQLSVGAQNVVTRGKNPFAAGNALQQDEGTIPYVRYQQDL